MFHGTSISLGEGEFVLPSTNHQRGSVSDGRSGYAYATPSLSKASGHARDSQSRIGGFPRVYVVEPLGHVEDNPGEGPGEVRSSDGFRVVGTYQDT